MAYNHNIEIYQLVDKLEDAKEYGDKFRSTCPLCGSKSARPFILFPNGGYFCHVCNQKGSVFSLIRDVFKQDISNFKDVIEGLNPTFEVKSRRETYDETEKNIQRFLYIHNIFHDRFRYNRELVYRLLYELIPKETEYLTLSKNDRYIGYDNRNKTLTVSLIDQDDYHYDYNRVLNIKRRKVKDIKWMGLKGGDGKYAPHRLTGKKFVYVASGMAEFLILNASDLDYIVMQSDGADINHLIPNPDEATVVVIEDCDKRDIKDEEDKKYKCFKNPEQFNPFKKKVTDKIKGDKIAIDFEQILDREVKAGYDLRDFVNEHPSDWLDLINEELYRQYNQVRDEIVIPYSGRFPNFKRAKSINRGVVISKPHSGKTYAFEKTAGTLIIVPKVEQSNVHQGEDTYALLDHIFKKDGAIITFHKFYGHYVSNEDFKDLIDRKSIKLIVDEAHELVFNPSKEFQLIYNLDAIFLSGTLDKTFRPDLQRYKYKPEEPDVIFYTKGDLPSGYRSIIFIDNAKALKRNYPDNAVVSKKHKEFKSVDIHTTDKDVVFTTSALREGVSIKNRNFNACMVYAQGCRRWNTKQKIQALYRLRRDDSMKIISAPPKEEYTKRIDFDWWENFINSNTEDKISNTIMGEHYSEMMKITHKVNGYDKADNYSIVCYLSKLTGNNYDKDFFKFVEFHRHSEPLPGRFEPLEINTQRKDENEDDEEYFTYTFEADENQEKTKWIIPKNKRKMFDRWLYNLKSGLIAKLIKLKSFKNLNEIYKKSNVAKVIKAQYNKIHKKRGKKYTIYMFYKLLRDLVKIEIIDDKSGKVLQRVGSKTNLKEVSIRVVDSCSIKGIKVVNEMMKKAKKIKEKSKKWLDKMTRVVNYNGDRDLGILVDLSVQINKDSSYNILIT